MISPESVPGLKTLVVGGEVLPNDIVGVWSSHVNLINAYGPAECSVTVACNVGISLEAVPFSIGTPVGAQLWIVNPQNHDVLLPIGSTGEILVEGWSLAKEYHKDPGQTNSAFIESPLWSRKPLTGGVRRFYKTGDLARWTWDGQLIFIGRKDNIAKLRGLKVELGQVETAIRSIVPSSWTVAVEVTRASSSNPDNAVVAIICEHNVNDDSESVLRIATPLAPETTFILATVRKELSSLLPLYMIPTIIIPLQRMPLTAYKKINRKELLSLNLTSAELVQCLAGRKTKQAPTLHEVKMAHLWESVLGLSEDSISSEDNFFHVGGNSLAAMQLVQLSRANGLSFHVADIFHHPVLAELANRATVIVKATSNYTPQ